MADMHAFGAIVRRSEGRNIIRVGGLDSATCSKGRVLVLDTVKNIVRTCTKTDQA